MSLLDEIKKYCLAKPFTITMDENYVKLSDIEKILGEKCEWVYDTNGDGDCYYNTSCDNAFIFTDGEKEAEFIYCPYCGKEIKEVKDEN